MLRAEAEGSPVDLQAGGRENTLGIVLSFEISKPSPVTFFLQQGHTHLLNPTQSIWGLRVQMPKL